MIEIDGSQYSGSGTIVRQAVAFSALTGQPVPIVHARTRRPKPGLRHQHIRVVQAIGELVHGTAEGLSPGSQEIIFRPGTLRTGGRYLWDIDVQYDRESLQPGAVLALFADFGEGVRLGSDQAGALRRTAEFIGKHVAKQLLEDMKTGATVDRFTVDQIIPLAALAEGESRFHVEAVTDHLLTNLWLVEKFLGVRATLNDHTLSMTGFGFQRQ